MGKRCLRLVAPLAVALMATTLSSQTDSGSSALRGIVLDASGKSISGVQLSILNEETGYKRDVASGTDGRYFATVLPVGSYRVEVKANGFQTATFEHVGLTVGDAASLDLKLKVAATSDTVTVVAETAFVDTEATATGTSINEKAIENLPVRGRNFVEFAQLTPGINQESDRSGLVIAGQRSINSNVSIDGADFNDPLQGNQRGGNAATFFFPQSAVREFQVVRSGASAEIGRTNAGFVNVVTKTGTNDIHGDVFYFNRNRTFTSPDAFGRKLNNLQNQFGGSFGGPLVKNKAFYFVAAEQNFLRVPFVVQFQRQAAGVVIPADLLALQGEQRGTNSPTALYIRQDTNLSSRHQLNIAYTFSRARGENFNFDSPQIDSAASANYQYKGDSHSGRVGLTSVLTPGIVNELRGQIATDFRNESPNATVAQIVIAGFGTLGGDSGRPRVFDNTRYQIADNMSWQKGRHFVRFGVDVNVNSFLQQRASNIQGRYDFTTLTNYVNRTIGRFRQTLPGFNPDDLLFTGFGQELGLFVSDKWAISRNVTISAGLRWDGQWNPQPDRPNPRLPQTAAIPNDLQMWQPRLGIAWNLRPDGRTVLRVNGGLLSARTPANLFQRVFTENGITTVAVDSRTDASILPLLRFPNALTTLPANLRVPAPRVFGFDPAFRNPQSGQMSVTLEHGFGKDWVVSAGYLRNSTWALQRRFDRNLLPPTINAQGVPIFPSTRPISGIGWFSVNESTAHSSYDALILTVNRRFAKRLQWAANYTYAKNFDNDSNERNFSRETTLNVFDAGPERAYSKQDVRSNFNTSGIVQLPWGLQFSAIIIARTGVPYTRVIGFDTQGDANDDNDRAIINGRVAGRNDQRQPSFFDLDVRLQKTIRFGDRRMLFLSAEGFNMTKHANRNFGNDAISAFGTTAAPVATADQALFAPSAARYGGPRQLQLGVRFTF